MRTACGMDTNKIKFESLERAKIACSADNDCIAIQDKQCDSEEYTICDQNVRISKTRCSFIGCDCGYLKESFHGT